MSANIPVFFVHQYSTNVQLLLQQKGSRLRSAVMGGSHVGSMASPVDQIEQITANLVVSRFADMPRVDALLKRRWAFPKDYDLPQLIDSFDKLRLLTDPTSHYVMNAVYALGRAMDVEILTAMFGSSATGVEGATAVTFPTTQRVVVAHGAAAASHLSVAKLREAKRILMANEVDLDSDTIYAAINATEHDALLAETQIIDADYNGGNPVLVDGRVMRFLGINFIHTELVPTGLDDTSTAATLIPVWAKSGMYLGMWSDIMTDICQRKDLQSLPWQAYVKGTFGATRLDEKRVVQICCR